MQPLVDKIMTGLPPWKANLLTKAGRTVLVKAKLSAIPFHTALAISLSPWVVQCIDKRRHAFLWKGADSVSGGHCLLAWPKVCRPADLGGLGLPDLTIQGCALRMRWLWLKRTNPNRPWSRLPENSETVVDAMFNASEGPRRRPEGGEWEPIKNSCKWKDRLSPESTPKTSSPR